MNRRNLSVSVDLAADAAYVALSDATVARTDEAGEGIMIDYDADGRPVGVEILSVKSRIGKNEPNSYLRGLAEGVLASGRQAAE